MTMQILISLALAYVLCGVSLVMKDLGSSGADRPSWARHPTSGKVIFVALTWFTRPFIDAYYSTGQRARAVAFGLLGVAIQIAGVAGFIWCCIAVVSHFFDGMLWIVLTSAAFIVIGAPIAIPLITLLSIPLTLLVSLPLDLFFPLKDKR